MSGRAVRFRDGDLVQQKVTVIAATSTPAAHAPNSACCGDREFKVCRIAWCYNPPSALFPVIPGTWQTSNSAYLLIRSETDTYRRFTAKVDLVRGGRGDWRMPAILTDFLLFCCMAAFAIGVVIVAANIFG